MDEPWLLLPVKRWSEAKQRLAAALAPAARADLARHLTTRTLDVIHAAAPLRAVVVTADPAAAALARRRGFDVWPDEGDDHSSALRAAAERAAHLGATGIVTLAIDLPLMQVHDVRALIAGARERTLLLATDRHGTGTNAVVVAPPVFPFAFGPGSLARHRAAGRALGLDVRVLRRRGLARDIDEPCDLRWLPGDWRVPPCATEGV